MYTLNGHFIIMDVYGSRQPFVWNRSEGFSVYTKSKKLTCFQPLFKVASLIRLQSVLDHYLHLALSIYLTSRTTLTENLIL